MQKVSMATVRGTVHPSTPQYTRIDTDLFVCLVVISYKNLFFQSLNYDTIENELHWQEKEKPNVKVITGLESTLLSGVLIVILGLVLANQYLRCIIWRPLYKGGSL